MGDRRAIAAADFLYFLYRRTPPIIHQARHEAFCLIFTNATRKQAFCFILDVQEDDAGFICS